MRLSFDNSFARELPADPSVVNQRRQVFGACYSRVVPTPVSAPYLVGVSSPVARALGLSEADVHSKQFLELFSGNLVPDDAAPLAACYGGHQFGNWAGQLGDGRAISLGEVIDVGGRRQELQLKGAGPTPYSRMGDGRAVLRSSIREFLCSEAMHHLGVPTTRALCVLGTGDLVKRDLLYDGNERLEPGAVVCRVAPSFIRFGSFEIFASRDDLGTLRALAEHTLRRHFPHLLDAGKVTPSTYTRWFAEVCASTASMVAHWMRVGFVHGVLNTDNMSVLGLTIDYGPYGWIDDYDPTWTPNTTDAATRRYRFGAQPRIAAWNLARFAESLLPLSRDLSGMEAALEGYAGAFDQSNRDMQRQKLGFLPDSQPLDGALCADTPESLHESLLQLMGRVETDMTLFYRGLAQVPDAATDAGGSAEQSDELLLEPLLGAYYSEPSAGLRDALVSWLHRYQRCLVDHGVNVGRRERMDAVNPKYVLRNYLAQLAIDEAEDGDYTLVQQLLEVLSRPYEEQPGRERFEQKRPEWARSRPGCSMLSCSS